jgi:hypothetical protein
MLREYNSSYPSLIPIVVYCKYARCSADSPFQIRLMSAYPSKDVDNFVSSLEFENLFTFVRANRGLQFGWFFVCLCYLKEK